MKSIKTAIAAIATLASTIAFGGGLYIVSGGDFREAKIKYVIETTNDNQEVEITPYSLVTLGAAGSWANNLKHTAPWSIKTDGKEFTFSPYSMIRTTGGTQGVQVEPFKYTYPKAGLHTVKLFDEKSNIYQIKFYNPNVVSLYLKWSDIPSGPEFPDHIKSEIVMGFPNLKTLYWEPYDGKNTRYLPDFARSNLVSCIFPNANVYTVIPSWRLSNCPVTNDMVFVNVTNISSWAFSNSPNIRYASFPNIISIGDGVLNNHKYGSATKPGLRRLRIGDTLESLSQTNPFYMNPELTTIEFVTDQEDFVAAWNNHAIFPNWLGTASKQEGDSENEATITPITGNSNQYYTTTSNWPKPTRLVRVRRSEIQ